MEEIRITEITENVLGDYEITWIKDNVTYRSHLYSDCLSELNQLGEVVGKEKRIRDEKGFMNLVELLALIAKTDELKVSNEIVIANEDRDMYLVKLNDFKWITE